MAVVDEPHARHLRLIVVPMGRCPNGDSSKPHLTHLELANSAIPFRMASYHEIAPHLVLMAFLQRVVNGGGMIDREYAVGSGRLDLYVRWPWSGVVDTHALELKVRTDRKNPLGEGLDQLAGYLRRLGLDHGTLVIFDRRTDAPPVDQRGKFEEEVHDGLNITILWL